MTQPLILIEIADTSFKDDIKPVITEKFPGFEVIVRQLGNDPWGHGYCVTCARSIHHSVSCWVEDIIYLGHDIVVGTADDTEPLVSESACNTCKGSGWVPDAFNESVSLACPNCTGEDDSHDRADAQPLDSEGA